MAAYVAVVVYKLFRRKKRVQMNQYQDPERLTDDKDWTTRVHAREVSERTVDGLCMDTLSGTTKFRRKASIPSVNQFLGASKVPNVPVDPSQTNSDDKQNGRDKTRGMEPQASAGLNQDTSHYVVTPAERNSPEVVRRSEYNWETLLCQPSNVRSKRSQSFNWDDPEYKRPNGKTRSLKLASEEQGQVKRPVRSKSLRGYTHRELAVLSASETAPFDKTLISVKRGNENAKRNKSKNPKTQKTVTRPGNVTKEEGTAKNKQINRSGSAPSVRAKEKLENTKAEGSLNRRHSSRWIPDPDYQTVSMEELVSAAQQVKGTRNESVVVVEIHNVPRDRDPKVTTLVGTATSEVVDASSSTSIQQSAPSPEDQTNCSTTVDVKSLPIPGVARRVPTVLPNDKSPDKNEETNISIKDTHERGLSVKNRTQNLETQVVDVQPNTRHFQANYEVAEAPLTIDINNNSQTLPNWRQKQTAREATNKPNIESNQIGQPSFKANPKVGSIGKLTLVKHVETPVRGGNPEITPKNHSTSFEHASSTQMRQLTDVSSPRNVTLLLRNLDEQRENVSSHAPVCAPPPAPPFTVDSRPSRQGLDNEVKINITPKDSQDAISVLNGENNPTVKDTDTNLTLEERKKTWKREQILDQLHSARARNGNQNYIFGTGLAYQSCMPELQNKLKELTLAK